MEALRVLVQPGTGYDLLLSALVVADRSSRSRVTRADELQRLAATVGPAIVEPIRRIGREPFISLLGWAHVTADPPTSEHLLAALRSADPAEVKLGALGYHRRAMRDVTDPATIQRAAAGDRGAIAEMRRTSFPGLRHWRATLGYLLEVDAVTFRDELLLVLGEWHRAGFATIEADVARRQDAAAAGAREVLARHGLLGALEVLAPGMTFANELAQSAVVLVPSVVIAPTWALTDHGPTLVIAFPALERDTGDARIERLARLADALGDPIRIRALAELRTGPLSTSELARRLGIPRTSLQHHLAVLMAAGLAAMAVDDARTGHLELRPDALAELARLATSAIAGEE